MTFYKEIIKNPIFKYDGDIKNLIKFLEKYKKNER